MITTGQGSFTATISRLRRTIEYELSYGGLEGGEVRQAHIHAAQKTANGGIVAWLCGSATNPAPDGVDVAPARRRPGPSRARSRAADVQAASVPAQGFEPTRTSSTELVTALRAGVAYANVHTATSPGGEIRGQMVDRQDD